MLTIHRSERADRLVDGLAGLLADPPDDPFTPDVVAVPSKGVERWISQRLSASLGAQPGRGDGVCANVVFPPPSRLVAQVVAAGSGLRPDDDPWSQPRLTWPLLDVIDECAGEDWCVTLGRHLGRGRGGGEGRRLAVAQKLAGLYASYASQRPEMLREWLAGDDTDGLGQPLDADLSWQAELWRRLRAVVGVASPAEQVGVASDRARAEPGLVDLPDRLSLFGPTRLTADQLAVVEALAEHRDVHLWLPHPSHGCWDRVESVSSPSTRRADDSTADLARHPLVRSLGRDARELQLRIAAHTEPDRDEYLPGDDSGEGLLAALQRDIREDTAPNGARELSPDDRSVQVHACHGRQRQVEVLREAVLGALADDSTLELRDVIVMCPDIESFAPLISAAFGLADDDVDEAHPGHRLRVRLADRAVRQTNPVLTVVAALLDLADARLTASQVLDLAAMPPVRARFGFDDDALDRVGEWVRASGVRWGLDADARRTYRLEHTRQNTWQAGLDRLLLGAAMDEDGLRTLGLALPLDDVDSNDVDLAGKLAELVDRLARAVGALTRAQTPRAWADELIAAIDSLTAVAPYDAWQHTQARWQVADALSAAGERAETATLRVSDIRALLADRLRGRPTRANFRTGHLTMCTMVPMRSVPHRVVCLLGLDDGVFPRGASIDGDDVLARSPLVGERDPRSEDRELFLDAILAARERLIVVYTGADERTGAERPPAVPLGELLDVLDRTMTVESGRVRDHVVVRHPLQPFDARNFVPGALGEPAPFSFDRASYDGSAATLADRTPAPPFLAGPLAEAEPVDTVEVDVLVRFLEHPVRAFLRDRLGITAPRDDDEPADALPVDISKLDEWAVGDRLLEAGLRGLDRERAVRAEWLRGELPPGPLGTVKVDPIADDVDRLVAETAGLRAGTPEAVDAAVDLAGGLRLFGTIPGVHGDSVVRVVYSKLGPKHRLRAWVQYLALAAAIPGREWATATVGRSADGRLSMSCVTGVDAEQAAALLESLVELYRRGLREPLPLPPRTACAYAEQRRHGGPVVAVKKAEREWRRKLGDGREIGEFDDVDHRLVWADAAFDHLLATPAEPDAAWADEPHRLGQLARTVWEPLLAAETIHER